MISADKVQMIDPYIYTLQTDRYTLWYIVP
jgi:hypothetical protein